MGLCNSAQTFQRMVEHVLNDLEGVFVYLDDIMVFSEEATHDLKLEAIFKHLEDAGLSISLNKCKFLKKKIDYLRYEVSEAGIRPLSKKVEAIKKFPIPTKRKELLHYLGAINYFRASLGQLSTEDGGKPKSVTEILMPLYSLGTCNIAKGTSITDIWKHSPKIRKAVEESKRLLTNASNLNFPNQKAPLALTCNASLLAMGATLEQYIGRWHTGDGILEQIPQAGQAEVVVIQVGDTGSPTSTEIFSQRHRGQACHSLLGLQGTLPRLQELHQPRP